MYRPGRACRVCIFVVAYMAVEWTSAFHVPDYSIPPNIRKCGAVATHRPLPGYELRNTRLAKGVRGGPEGYHNAVVTLAIRGSGEVTLERYHAIADVGGDWDPAKRVNWDHVAGRRIALGWLADAPDLLLVSWIDRSEIRGSGLYEMQHYAILRVLPGKCSILLRVTATAGARMRYVGNGLGQHYFTYRAASRALTDRAAFYRQLRVGPAMNPLPLYHLATEGDAAKMGASLATVEAPSSR